MQRRKRRQVRKPIFVLELNCIALYAKLNERKERKARSKGSSSELSLRQTEKKNALRNVKNSFLKKQHMSLSD